MCLDTVNYMHILLTALGKTLKHVEVVTYAPTNPVA